ncbi:Translocation protein sec66 [Cyphellophora attinorum]|uniref:Translocation protein sec66 n=1 Tax=Cyphellophora attinorum TaxID=1664694 RepID=A0A0N1H4H5_9EURO|nr:Translocation protein sec66 [Phialophora attinorum]KPI35617.1 Translocation protein sec66 [Phialophora attinorum]
MASLTSLYIPITYLGLLVGAMYTFSHIYRRRQRLAKQRLAPYFPSHTARDAYLSLLHLPDTVHGSDKPVKVPDSVLKAALLNRAVTDVQRILHLRTRKPALSTLLQRGVVGDEIYQRLLRAEQEMEAEVQDVIAEAKASEMVQNEILKEKLAKHRDGIEQERQQWLNTKEATRKELMGESSTVEEVKKTEATGRDAYPTPPPDARQADEKSASPPPPKTASSDEDGVLVDTPGDAAAEATISTSGGGGGKKKKKGKK